MTPTHWPVLLLRGDIVLTAGKSWLARAIRWAQRTGNERPSVVNHVAGVVAPGFPWGDPGATIVESDVRVRRGTLFEYHADDSVFVFRPLKIRHSELDTLVAEAERRVGRNYGYIQLFAQLIDHKLFGGRVVARRLLRRSPLDICSRLWAELYAERGLRFGCEAWVATPDDIYDYCVAHPAKYALVWHGIPRKAAAL